MKAIRILTVALAAAAAAPAAAISIPAAKAVADNAAVTTVSGVVVQVGGSGARGTASNRGQFVIADSNGFGIIVDKNATTYTQPLVGDAVTIANGNKVTFSGLIELQPATAGDIIVTSSGNTLPSPRVYASVAAFLAEPTTNTITGDYVRINNVYLTGTAPSAGGTTTWLNASSLGSANWIATDNGVSLVTARIPSDTGPNDGVIYQNKVRPTLADSNDRFDLVGTANIFGGVLQFQIAAPAGTTAKTDTTGPIRTATVPVVLNAATDWNLFQ